MKILLQKLHRRPCQHLNTDRHSTLVHVKARMVMWILCTLRLISRTHNEVAARDSVQEVGHIVAAGRHHLLTVINLIRSYRLNRSFLDDFGHGGIIGTGWTAIKDPG